MEPHYDLFVTAWPHCILGDSVYMYMYMYIICVCGILQAQQDALNRQHQAEKERAKAEISGLHQRLEEVCSYMYMKVKLSMDRA